MSTEVSATRMELLKIRKRIKLAKKGHGLLKRKRDALIKTFFSLIAEYRELHVQTIARLKEGYETLHIAQGVSGVNRMKGFAFSAQRSFSIDFSKKNVMGVSVPNITVETQDASMNASLIGTSYYVQDAHTKFQQLLPGMVKLAETEQVLIALADEITKTKRRVNALEHIQIPRLEETKTRIADRLAEVERESFIRLKHVKKHLENA